MIHPNSTSQPRLVGTESFLVMSCHGWSLIVTLLSSVELENNDRRYDFMCIVTDAAILLFADQDADAQTPRIVPLTITTLPCSSFTVHTPVHIRLVWIIHYRLIVG